VEDVPCLRASAWCEDCGAYVELDEPLHPRETVTCTECVDRMTHRSAEHGS
jgi:hypothetical protein